MCRRVSCWRARSPASGSSGAQIGVTALAALVAMTVFHSIHVPAIRGAVLAWVVIWFVLGYILYATIYGALGSLGSRVEDAQSVAGPISVVLVVAYFASFAMIGQPTSALARAISDFPLTAPMAMPGRIAMGATTWWEPLIAAALTLAATVVLVRIAGRLYTSAILHGGPRLSLRGAWQGRTASGPAPATAMAHAETLPHPASALARPKNEEGKSRPDQSPAADYRPRRRRSHPRHGNSGADQ